MSKLRQILLAVLVVLVAAFALAACGGGDDDGEPEAPAQVPRTARAEDFPAARGGSLRQLFAGISEGPILSRAGAVFNPGRNRFAFALFDRGRNPVTGAEVALYVARVDGTKASGPYPARSESLEVRPQFESRISEDADDVKTVYVVDDLPFPRRGKFAVIALARLDGRLVATTAEAIDVRRPSEGPPAVGDKAPRIDTPTATDVGGDLGRIETRIPPDTMHEVSFADVVGKRPTVLMFATPALCQSRVCGPVVDVAEQVKAKYGDRVAWVHQEVFRDNKIENGYVPQMARYRLPTEPWAFVVDRTGRIAARFEGAFSPGELDRAVAKVAGAG